MQRAKGRKNLWNRRAFVALGAAALGACCRLVAAGTRRPRPPPSRRPSQPAAKPAPQRARLPKRLAADFHSHIETRLPHLRSSFEAAGRETGFNWRMLAALGYQESRWRPAAVSPRGAQGVMMLMPLTATKMGVKNVFSPDENIMAGSRYLLLHEGAHSETHPRSRPHAARHGGLQHRHRPSRGRAHHHADAQEEPGSLGGRARQPAAAVRSRTGTSASNAVTPTAARPRSSSSGCRSSPRSSRRRSPSPSWRGTSYFSSRILMLRNATASP